jgi:hypothetical protein
LASHPVNPGRGASFSQKKVPRIIPRLRTETPNRRKRAFEKFIMTI